MMIYVLIWSFILSKSMIFAPFPCRNVSKEFPIKDIMPYGKKGSPVRIFICYDIKRISDGTIHLILFW